MLCDQGQYVYRVLYSDIVFLGNNYFLIRSNTRCGVSFIVDDLVGVHTVDRTSYKALQVIWSILDRGGRHIPYTVAAEIHLRKVNSINHHCNHLPPLTWSAVPS